MIDKGNCSECGKPYSGEVYAFVLVCDDCDLCGDPAVVVSEAEYNKRGWTPVYCAGCWDGEVVVSDE